MQIREKKYNYLANNQSFSFKEKLANWVSVNAYVVIWSEKFLEYQKDLLQDFLADFIDKSNTEIYDEWDLKSNLEECLQNLNVNLRKFADKVKDVDRFSIKGYIQIIAGNVLMASMIWDNSIIIFRDNKLYYQLHNWVSKKAKIDVFSDFVEWDIESGDEIIYVGTKISDVLDQWDIKEMESILWEEDASLLKFFEQAVLSRVDKENLWMIASYSIHGNLSQPVKSISTSKKKLRINSAWTKKLLANKYYVTILVLSVVILFMLYNVLSQLLNTSKQSVFTTASWVILDITIDDIKKDILAFKQMDSTSDQKWVKYSEIVDKLNMLENKWRWLEDVENLKWIIQDDYYKWFNIIRIENLSQLDDTANGIKTRLISMNTAEKQKIWSWLFVDYQRWVYIWWSKWSLIGAVNDGSRWSLIEYNIEDTIAWCSSNLLRDGIYCYTKDWRIFSVTKSGVEPLTTSDATWFPDTIWWIGVYGKANLYVFQPNLTSSLNGVFVTKYRNTVWSQTAYQAWQNYSLMAWYESGVNIVWDFSNVAIDSTFLTWNNNKLYQLRRPWYGVNLDIREVKLLWWDQITNKYSDNVKVISHLTSKYIYLFDKINKTFTVYTSNPLKTSDQYNTQYNLYYLFSFNFDLSNEDIVDVAIPESTWNRPEMYVLTSEWVNKINLYEYIDSIVKDETLKAISDLTPTNELN